MWPRRLAPVCVSADLHMHPLSQNVLHHDKCLHFWLVSHRSTRKSRRKSWGEQVRRKSEKGFCFFFNKRQREDQSRIFFFLIIYLNLLSTAGFIRVWNDPSAKILYVHDGEKPLAHAGQQALMSEWETWLHTSRTPPAVAQTENQVHSRPTHCTVAGRGKLTPTSSQVWFTRHTSVRETAADPS